MQLPTLGDAVIKFTVTRQERAVHRYYKPHLALDDIEITNGICPDFGKKNIDLVQNNLHQVWSKSTDCKAK